MVGVDAVSITSSKVTATVKVFPTSESVMVVGLVVTSVTDGSFASIVISPRLGVMDGSEAAPAASEKLAAPVVSRYVPSAVAEKLTVKSPSVLGPEIVWSVSLLFCVTVRGDPLELTVPESRGAVVAEPTLSMLSVPGPLTASVLRSWISYSSTATVEPADVSRVISSEPLVASKVVSA